MDEATSLVISSYNDAGRYTNYDEDKRYTGKEVKEITYWENNSVKNAFEDVILLRKDVRDAPHTNLYYSCLRLWFTGVQTGDIQRIIIQLKKYL